MKETKDNIRKRMREQRDEHDPVMRKMKSDKILNLLKKQREYIDAQNVCFYLSKGSEVVTHELIKNVLNEGNKKVIVPVTDAQNKKIILSVLKAMHHVKTGAFGVLEPQEDKRQVISHEEVDLFIVPGVAFDVKGYRIGYGGGYYDKLLKWVKKPKLGIAYSFQMVEHIPKNKNDVPMDKVITEKGIYGKNT